MKNLYEIFIRPSTCNPARGEDAELEPDVFILK